MKNKQALEGHLDLMEEVLKAKYNRVCPKHWIKEGLSQEAYLEKMLPIKYAIIKAHKEMK